MKRIKQALGTALDLMLMLAIPVFCMFGIVLAAIAFAASAFWTGLILLVTTILGAAGLIYLDDLICDYCDVD